MVGRSDRRTDVGPHKGKERQRQGVRRLAKSEYAGKIGLDNVQKVPNIINSKSGKNPKVTKGGDLRSK